MDGIINVLNMVMVFLVLLIFGLFAAYILIGYKNKNKSNNGKNDNTYSKKENGQETTNTGLTRESIYKFMEFENVKDNMIIRKNRQQYVMVIQCQGVNYDLLSENEKIAVEEGFVQFLNTLRFPVQLYVQTRSLNLREIIDKYMGRVKLMEQEVGQIREKIKLAQQKGDKETLKKLKFEEKRKVNVLEYGADITEYIGRLSLNKNVLQQKTYVIVSYYASEFGSVANYSKEEIDNLCFSELYTRCQSVIRTLAAAEVTGKILDSEELAELLYIAYNRDDSDILQLSKALDAEYNCLYSTSKDILIKKQDLIDKKIEEEAVDLVTESIIDADKEIKKQAKEALRKRVIHKKALELAEEYEEQMEPKLYEETVKQIEKKSKLGNKTTKEDTKNIKTEKQTPKKTIKTVKRKAV